ncbi:hypothetical protein ACLMJK_004779 [Lecanora helva]
MIEDVANKTQQRTHTSALAYWFCDYMDPATHDVVKLLGSLASQFAAQDESCFNIANRLYQEHSPDGGSVMFYKVEVLKQCLLDMMKCLDHVFIIIDALDECLDNQAEMLETLQDLNNFENDNVKTLFTGRDEYYLQRALSDYDKLSIAANSRDLRLYVDAEIGRRSKKGTLRISDPGLQEEVREKLVTGAMGIRKALTSLPPDLPTTYKRILDRINLSSDENQRIVQRVLRWILWAVEPLPLPALSEAICVSIGDRRLDREAVVEPEAILELCGSLVRKNTEAGTLELAHYSVKEFLESVSSDDSSYLDYQANINRDSLELAMTCLTYLQLDDFDLDLDHFDDLQKPRLLMDNYNFLPYCVRHWYKHVLVVEDNQQLAALLQGFLKIKRTGHMVTWISCFASMSLDVAGEVGSDDGLDVNSDEIASSVLSKMADCSSLHWAAKMCLPSTCRWLVAQGSNVDQKSDLLGRPLYAAIVSGSAHEVTSIWFRRLPFYNKLFCDRKSQTAKVLIDAGADCNIKGSDSQASGFPLMEAILQHDGDMTRLLLNAGALCDRNSLDLLAGEDGEGNHIFHDLSESNIEPSQIEHYRELAISLDFGWDRALDSTEKSKALEMKSGIEIKSLFLNAAKFGRLEAMQQVIPLMRDQKSGRGIEEVDRSGDTALHLACKHNHPEIVEELIRRDMNLNCTNTVGQTPLLIAAKQANDECIRILLQHGANMKINDCEGSTALHRSALLPGARTMDCIMQYCTSEHKDFYTRNNEGFTPLHVASLVGSLPVIQSILKHFPEASLFERISPGATCLHLAAKSGSIAVASFLLDHGIAVNETDDNGYTPMIYAAEFGHDSNEMVKFLHSRGGDVNTVTSAVGATPLFHSIVGLKRTQNPAALDCFEYILKHTEDINHRDSDGWNALHWLFEDMPEFLRGYCVEVAFRTLVDRGCSLVSCDAEGVSAFQRLIAQWSQLEFEESGEIHNFHKRNFAAEEDEADGCFDFGDLRSPIAMTCIVLKYVRLHSTTIELPENVSCRGASLLSLAIRTNDLRVIREVLNYDENVDRKDTLRIFLTRGLKTPIEWMCQGAISDPRMIKTLLASSKTLERPNEDSLDHIHIAAEFGNITVLEELLSMGISPDRLSFEKMTPLMYACYHREFEAIRLLYKNGARIIISKVWDSLRFACGAGHRSVLSTVLDLPGLRTDLRKTFQFKPKDLREIGPIENMTYLHVAAYFGQANVITWLLEKDTELDVNLAVGVGEVTALYLAACQFCSELAGDFMETIALLLIKGADPSTRCGASKATALHRAAACGNPKVIELLLAHGGDPTATDVALFTPLLVALRNHQDVAADLLKGPLPISVSKYRDRSGDESPPSKINDLGVILMRNVQAGRVNMTEHLLDRGANVNTRDPGGNTPVLVAAFKGQLGMLDLLKERGADFGAINEFGCNALHQACSGGSTTVIPGLLELGLNLLEKDLLGWTPLHHAVYFYQRNLPLVIQQYVPIPELSPSLLSSLISRSIVSNCDNYIWILNQLTKDQKADALNAENPDQCPPLHNAALRGTTKTLEILVDAGADIDLRSAKIGTPLQCAAMMDRMEAVQLLAKKGAKLRAFKSDGSESNAIDAAKNYPAIQQWLRDFYHPDDSRSKLTRIVEEIET